MKVVLRNPSRTEVVAGPARVGDILDRLAINPETVLVIHAGELVTKDVVLADDAELEVRPVISGGAGPARCQQCRGTAVIEVQRHHAAYCAEHLVDHVRTQVREAIDRHRMVSYNDRILVAVSGGKDSLALWDLLLDMGYRADGLYLGLGIGEYSDHSGRLVAEYAATRDAALHTVDLADEYGYDIPDATGMRNRSSCGVCGLSKRYVFNRVALEHGYDVMATGHNLDDEAAQLLGNVLRWQTPFMARQSVALPATADGLARKVKPLYRLGEREMAAYCVIRGLEYVVEECPMVGGNTVLRYKAALNELERSSPGTKAQFLFGFLDRVQSTHFANADPAGEELVACSGCGLPTTRPRQAGVAPVCAFCRTRERVVKSVGRRDGVTVARP
ncbi:MAG: tRNA(Ile)-lysidine synthetase [Actinomycetota bacterium]|jgi:tRNA(Ile)-lysidine synthase TilS/MesJ/sulfur carrier protein ThiS|nr:tRNA(Ile)-lysidine synthetase [Actinomycetota bacterium]